MLSSQVRGDCQRPSLAFISTKYLISKLHCNIINKVMDIFTTGLVVLFVMTAIFYIVLFSFIYYWHLKKITFVVVPVFFTFEFFIAGFLIISIISIVVNFLPELLTVTKWQ